MAKSMVDPVVADGDILTASQWLAEFQNILTNSQDLINPLLGNIDLNQKNLLGGGTITTNTLNSFTGGILKQDSVIFNAQVADASIAGQLERLSGVLRFHDGVHVRTMQVMDTVAQSGLISNTAAEQLLYSYTLPGNLFGTTGCLEIELLFAVGLLSGSAVTLRYYVNSLLWMTLGIGNGTGITAPLTFAPIRLRLMGNGATNAQTGYIECTPVSGDNLSGDSLGSIANKSAVAAAVGVETAITQTIELKLIFSSADVNNQCRHFHGITKLMV